MLSNDVEKKDLKLVQPNPGFMQVDTFNNAIAVAEYIANSSFCPKGMQGKSGDIVCALQMGQELGLKPMQALQNIAVINGRPSLYGDAMLAVCRQSRDFEYIKEEYLTESNAYICRVKRKNEPEFTQSFTEKDARLAALWGKPGPWTQYPKRMLQMRARGFCLRDAFPDLLRGILVREEAEDMPSQRVDYSQGIGETIEGKPISEATINAEQIDTVRSLIAESGSEEIKICQFLKVGSIELMTVAQWIEVCRLLDKKIREKSKNESLEINQEGE